ncbi:MAG: thioredoxin domain-containing protein [bacterium]|jgi:uncharacterized protein YyaL (SSP411 family)
MLKSKFDIVLLAVMLLASADGAIGKEESMNQVGSQADQRFTNRLQYETSPYLQQHAHNPVDWYPWGEEALQKARDEDKPIFLSIGYSACHWCHVMERESFENEAIARIMNEHFINIKVDREERPDLDEIYMSAVQAMTGSGGWPMSVFLTPDLKPFYGGTYFPPQDMYGRPGFSTLLKSIAAAWSEQREEIHQSAEQLTDHVRQMVDMPKGAGELSDSLLENAAAEISRRFDPRNGGFGTQPKFPQSMDLSFLLRYYHRHRDPNVLEVIEVTLQKMANGGIYDHLGGGFARYSVDAKWLIPHFEKMLYDNALLAKTYTEAWQMTNKPFYRKVAKETLDYVLREMTDTNGSFYSTQDADSEGVEGKFYVWTPDEIEAVLGKEDGKLINRYYDVTEQGNFEHGKSVLHVPNDLETIAKLYEKDPEELKQIILQAKCKLYAERDKRIKPGRDEKTLTDWNGLMISAMAFAGNAFGESKYIQAAERACDFILREMVQGDNLLHTYKDGRAHTDGFLSDYANFVHGLIDTYEATHNPRWLKEALQFTRQMIDLFQDEEGEGFFFTRKGQKNLIARSKGSMDNAVPSGNSIAALNLLRLSELTGNMDFRKKGESTLRVFSRGMTEVPMGYGQMLSALDFALSKPQEIVLAADSKENLSEMQQMLYQNFLPSKVVLYSYPEVQQALQEITPVIEGKTALNGRATAYVCQDFSCRNPVTSVEEFMEQITGKQMVK